MLRRGRWSRNDEAVTDRQNGKRAGSKPAPYFCLVTVTMNLVSPSALKSNLQPRLLDSWATLFKESLSATAMRAVSPCFKEFNNSTALIFESGQTKADRSRSLTAGCLASSSRYSL